MTSQATFFIHLLVALIVNLNSLPRAFSFHSSYPFQSSPRRGRVRAVGFSLFVRGSRILGQERCQSYSHREHIA